MATRTKIKAMIWDLGGVMFTFDRQVCWQRISDMEAHLTPTHVKEELLTSGLMRRLELGQISSQSFMSTAKERLGPLSVSDGAILDAWCDIFTPNPAVIDVIQRLPSDLRLVLGSNTSELHLEHLRNQFPELFGRFDAMVLSYEIGCLKPDQRFFKRCLEVADCEPRECFYLDDSSTHIRAAGGHGIKGLIYHPGVDIERELKDRGIALRKPEKA